MLNGLLYKVYLLVAIVAVAVYWIAPKIEIEKHDAPTDGVVVVPNAAVKKVRVEKIFQGKLKGPESFEVNWNTGELYTGTTDGLLWKISANLSDATVVVREGANKKQCGTEPNVPECGRVLGIKYMGNNQLIVSDLSRGILSICLKTGKEEILMEPEKDDGIFKMNMFNAMDVSKDGIIYFTVSTMKWARGELMYVILEPDNTGRVYSYNITSKQLSIVVSDLWFPNGLVLSDDETFLLVNEFTKRRILKINLKTPKRNVEVFLDNLPGSPDNIKRGSNGTFYVAFPMPYSGLIDFLFRQPTIRYWICWLVPQAAFGVDKPPSGEIYHISGNGMVLSVIRDEKEELFAISEAFETKDALILGSYSSAYVGVIKKSDV